MRELSLLQKAMLNGSVCPYCKEVSKTEGTYQICPGCGAKSKIGTDGKPLGRLADSCLLRAMDMVETEIVALMNRTGMSRNVINNDLSVAMDIPIKFISPYRMSMPSLIRIIRYIEDMDDNGITIWEDGHMGGSCPRHPGISIGSSGCGGCPEHLFHTDNIVVCDKDMSYGNRKYH